MLVSIITPCFNSEKTIRQTIESVLNQTYSNIEYIIIDGGSTDNTINIIKEYIPKFRGRLKYVSEKDKGIYDAMNKGIKMSKGQVIGIINSDDYYELCTVDKIIKKIDIKKYQVIYGYCNYVKRNRVIRIFDYSHVDLGKRMIPHPTCFVTRNTYKKYGLFNTLYKISADHEMMLRFKRSGVEFIQMKEILANFRYGGISSYSKRSKLDHIIFERIYGISTVKDTIKNLIIYIYNIF